MVVKEIYDGTACPQGVQEVRVVRCVTVLQRCAGVPCMVRERVPGKRWREISAEKNN
jgi:hypothetical protein